MSESKALRALEQVNSEQAERIEIAETAIDTALQHACPLCKDYLEEALKALSCKNYRETEKLICEDFEPIPEKEEKEE